MKTTAQVKRKLQHNMNQLHEMVAESHARKLSKSEMDSIVQKQNEIERNVSNLKEMGVPSTEMLPKKFDVGGVVQAYSTPQMAGNLTGGSWGATLYELGGVVHQYVSPALLQFGEGGKLEDRVQSLVGKYVYLFSEGVSYPSEYQIEKVQLASPKFQYRDLFFSLKNHDYMERIPSEKVEGFLRGEQVEIYNADKGEYYAFQLISNQMRKGGKIGFKSLAKKVARNYEGKKVASKYRKEYGSTYDKQEAQEVGNKVAAKVYRQQQGKMKNGGQAKVEILNDKEVFDDSKYKAILDDFDMDGLPNVDDPQPLKKGNKKDTIEQVQFSNTFKKVLNVKEDLNLELNNFVNKLRESAPEKSVIYGRTKTPFSILNKLVDTRLLDEKRGLKDLVGTTIAFDDIRDLQKFTEKTRKGFYGEVVDFDDFYSEPKDGYRAYHFIVRQNGVPIELQLKTRRMKDINVLSHDAYKKKNLNKDFMLYLTTLADQADRGNVAAQIEFSKLMQNKAQVENQLNN